MRIQYQIIPHSLIQSPDIKVSRYQGISHGVVSRVGNSAPHRPATNTVTDTAKVPVLVTGGGLGTQATAPFPVVHLRCRHTLPAVAVAVADVIATISGHVSPPSEERHVHVLRGVPEERHQATNNKEHRT